METIVGSVVIVVPFFYFLSKKGTQPRLTEVQKEQLEPLNISAAMR